MNEITLSNYGPIFAALLADAPLNELGPGKPLPTQRKQLETLSIDTAFAPHKVVDRTMAKACLAGLWLRFDFLDESHAISQEIKTPTGGFWHGIMHRREPDYDNAKYWFHRVGEHAVSRRCVPRQKKWPSSPRREIGRRVSPRHECEFRRNSPTVCRPRRRFLADASRVGPVPLYRFDRWCRARKIKPTILPRNSAARMGVAVRLLLPRSDRGNCLTASSPAGSCRWAIMQYGLSRSSRVFDRIGGG